MIALSLLKKSGKTNAHRVFACASKGEKGHQFTGCSDFASEVSGLKFTKKYTAALGSKLECNVGDACYTVIGLGNHKELTVEKVRRNFSKALKGLFKHEELRVDLDSFTYKLNADEVAFAIAEAVYLCDYKFDKYFSKKSTTNLKKITFVSEKMNNAKFSQIVEAAQMTGESVNFCRDLVNEVPNVLHSEHYAKIIEKDVKKNLKGVKVKILNKAQMKKENMNLLLSVNAGSGKEPRLVHLTYTPKKMSKSAKHIAVVGKGITFDTGGYSLKPSGSMVGMKFDMGGSATVYGAFRAAVLMGSKHKLTCVLAMTDNAVNEHATVPDSVVKGRSGKTVEILNTDAEGRLILADALDYTCDLKPDHIIDAATLTGACLVAFGSEVCALMGNDQKLVDGLLNSAKEADEYLWQLPIVPEYRDHIKSKVADIKNIGKARMAGTAVAAAFLEEFVQEGISWAHLDIAGVCDSQSHLPYCPASGGSGIMVRSLAHFLTSAK